MYVLQYSPSVDLLETTTADALSKVMINISITHIS